MLSGTLSITATDGSAFTVDSSEFDRVVVESGAQIGTLKIQGDASDIVVDIKDDARANSVSILGGAGAETLIIRGEAGPVNFQGRGGDDVFAAFAGSVLGSLNLGGDAGDDRFVIQGFNNGTTTVQGGAGIDRLVISDGAELLGDLTGSLGEGSDRVAFRSDGLDNQTRTSNVDLDLGAGANIFDFFNPTQVDGNFKLTGGDQNDVVRFRGNAQIDDINGNQTINLNAGNDQLTIAGAFDVNGNQNINLGENSDGLVFEQFTLQGNQNIDLGGATGGRDSLRFGADDINGSSKVVSAGSAFIQESAAREVQSDYTVEVGDAELALALAGGSTVMGNLSVTSGAVATVGINATLTMGNVTLSLGRGDDLVNLRGLTIENTNNLNVTTGAGADTVRLNGATVTGNSNVNVGADDDTVENDQFTVNGTATFVGGEGTDTISDPVQGDVSGFEGN